MSDDKKFAEIVLSSGTVVTVAAGEASKIPGTWKLGRALEEGRQATAMVEELLRRIIVPPAGKTIDDIIEELSIDDVARIFSETLPLAGVGQPRS